MTLSGPTLCKACHKNRKAVAQAQCRACDKPLCERDLFDLKDERPIAKRIRLIPYVERLLIAGAIRDVLCQGCSFNQAKGFSELRPELLTYWSTLPRVLDVVIMREISA